MELYALLAEAAPVMLRGAGYTVLFALASMVGGLLIGFPVALLRIQALRLVRWTASVYVSLMRGTPLLVQMFVIYYGLPGVGVEFAPVTAGVLALSLNAGAFLSESLCGAIQSVSRGQWAASYSLGLGYWPTMVHLVLPQALRMAVPAMSNTLNGQQR
jgi:cystine transport system permease protein